VGEKFRLIVTTALHQLPGRVLRDLAKRWPHDGNHAERVVADAIDEALLRSNWHLERQLPSRTSYES
jgi:hypothetical protein